MNKKYIANAAKPIGELGKKRVADMNEHHAPLVAWGFSFLPPRQGRKCLDLGCGGGGTISYLFNKNGASFCCGVDYSKVAVEEAKKKNEDKIEQGLCEILKGDVSSLPFKDESFDLVSAVETIYFWPNPLEALKEAYRVLKPGGYILIVNEDDGQDENKVNHLLSIMPTMKFYGENALTSLLNQAGFHEISIKTKSPWIVAIGQK